jgi:hypothetical protein
VEISQLSAKNCSPVPNYGKARWGKRQASLTCARPAVVHTALYIGIELLLVEHQRSAGELSRGSVTVTLQLLELLYLLPASGYQPVGVMVGAAHGEHGQ